MIPHHRVLVLEDSRTHAKIVSRMLDVRAADARDVFGVFSVTLVTTLADACARLGSETFDVVLADMHVSDSDGIATIRLLRSVEASAPIVVLTGSTDEQIGIDVVKAGASTFMRKSEITPALLIRSLHHAIERQHLVAELERMAWFDDLTGLRNRRGFFAAAGSLHARATRTGATLTAAFADLNDLKALNDHHGHAAGDAAIVALSEVLKRSVASDGVAGRLGGDEFCIVQPGSGPDFVDRFHDALGQVNDGARRPVRVSLGVVTGPSAEVPLEEMLRMADADLYAAKARKPLVAGDLVCSS